MMHGEKNGPAAELGKKCDQARRGDARKATHNACPVRLYRGARRGLPLFQRPTERTVLVDLRLTEKPFEGFAIVVVANQ